VNLRMVSTSIALALSAMLLGAGVYESVVVAPNLQGAPSSLEHARGFYHATNPGMFFRVLSGHTTFPSAGASVQLGADSCYAMKFGGSPGTCNFRRRYHIQVSLSPKHHPIWRSTDGVCARLRSGTDGTGRGKLCSHRRYFGSSGFGNGVNDPHRS
jgi:hypothetical protein